MTFTAPLEKVWGDGVVDSSSEPCFEAPFLSSEPTTGLSHRPGRVRTSALARTGFTVRVPLPSLPRVTFDLVHLLRYPCARPSHVTRTRALPARTFTLFLGLYLGCTAPHTLAIATLIWVLPSPSGRPH